MIQNISRTTHSINHGFNIDNHPSCPGYDGDPPRYPGHTSLPPPRYSSACQASQRSSSKRDTIKSLGVIGVIIGPICVFLSVSLILISGPSSYFRVPYIGCGIWGGILVGRLFAIVFCCCCCCCCCCSKHRWITDTVAMMSYFIILFQISGMKF